MTVSSEVNKQTYAGDGSTTSFSTVFTFAANDEVTVTKIVTATGVETEFTEGTEFTLTGAGTGSAGTVTISTSPTDHRPASGTKLVIQLKPDFTQTTDLPRGGTVSPADTLEPMHDSRVRQMLRLKDDVDRSLKLSIDETSAATLPVAAVRAGKILSFDVSTGAVQTNQEIGTFKGNWAASTAFVERDIVKDTSTNNIFIANTAHTSSGAQPLTTNTDSAKWDLIVDAASATTSATNAASSATAAAASSASATTAKTAAETAQAASETAKTAAETAQSSAASSSSSASTSAATATAQATISTTKAGEAAASATAAAASAAAAGVTVASQAEAETGTNNANLMTPLRTKQAVDSYGLLAANNLSDVTASTARTNLGLGDAATKTVGTSNGNVIAADATGLPAINASQVTALNASNLSSGTVPTARLGSGTASATTFLAGDGAWREAGGGKVVKYQNTNVATRTSTTSTFPDDDTVPQSTEGAEYTTVAYTPTEGGNKIVVHIIAQAAVTGNEIDMALALFKNSDASAIRSCFFENGPGSNNGPHIMSMMVEDTAADTSEITYKLRFGMVGNTSGTAYLGSGHHSIERFGDSAGVQIHITEYDA